MIGTLNHNIILEEAIRTSDGFGGVTTAWNEVARLWAGISGVDGRESLPDAERRLRITIRWRGGMKPSQRFTWDGRVFEIEAVRDPDGRARFLDCDCIERDLP